MNEISLYGIRIHRDRLATVLSRQQIWQLEQNQLAEGWERDALLRRAEIAEGSARGWEKAWRRDCFQLKTPLYELLRAVCRHFGIKAKYGLYDRVHGEGDRNPILRRAVEVSEHMDWHKCPR